MKEYQTPQKVSAGSAENRNGRSKDFPPKKSNKITKKSLNAEFTSVSKDSVDFSPISQISEANPIGDVKTFFLEEDSSVTLLPSDINPSTYITDKAGISSFNCFGASELNSLEAEIALKLLTKIKPELLNSLIAAPQYEKLMDVIIKYVIERNTMPKERDLSAKYQKFFLCFFIWIVAVLVVLFFTSDNHSLYHGPLPT